MSEALARLAKYRADLPAFAASCLKIRNKAGDIVPLVFNDVQLLVHEKLEAQKRAKGWVRAIILKARQPGISTYVAARFYARTSLHSGVSTYILAHEQPASDNLFGIVDRYQRHSPIAPTVGTANVKELSFPKLESSYVVATAGQKAGGRGRSVTLFHGSEVAFWANAADHFASSVQAVPLLPGTEVILESTANGPGGEFYERCQDAIAGRGDYILIFVPWFMTPEYSRPTEPGFELSMEAADGEMSEVEYADRFGLSLEQMAWRRYKISELRSEVMFRQEYPSTEDEAFVSAGHEPYIKPLYVLRARGRKREGQGPLILGVDPAGLGGDRFSVAHRRGMVVSKVEYRSKIDALEGSAWVCSLIDEHDPARVNIDAGNMGHAIITLVRARGPKYAERVRAVNFGGTAQQKLAKPKVPGPANRRAEMWQRMREWLEAEEGAALPDDAALQSDLTSPRLKPKLSGDFLLESKVDMKARGVRSPDLADAVCLTFASMEYHTKYSEAKKPAKFGDIDKPQAYVPQTSSNLGPQGWMA